MAGRLRSSRLMGKLTFAHIEDGTGRLQLFLRVNELGEEAMERFRRVSTWAILSRPAAA